MKKKKIIIISILAIIAITISTIVIVNILNDKERLTVLEKQWISDNKNNVISLNVVNDLNVFGKDGAGVFFDYINALSENHNIQINPVTFNIGEEVTGTSLTYSLEDNLNSFYDDEFVLVGKKSERFEDISKINHFKIGTTKLFKGYISNYISGDNDFIEFENRDELLKNFSETEELNYIVVPNIMYLDEILSKDYHIVYHISDAKVHYGVTKDNTEFSNIISKYFNEWKKKEYDKSFNEKEFNLFVDTLKISSTDIDKIKAETYSYGFINNGPYELISGGTFGGINAVYLKKIANLFDIKIDFVKYGTQDKLNDAIKDKKVNIYFDYYNISNDQKIASYNLMKYYIVAKSENNIVINSINGIKNKKVYVEKNTKLEDYLRTLKLDVVTYESDKELKKYAKDDILIVVDSNKYEKYKDNILNKYIVRFVGTTRESYSFVVTTNDVFNRIVSKYLEIIDNNQLRYSGLNNYYVTKRSGILVGTLARYILILLAIFIVLLIIVYRKGKKIKLAKKIKKEDKMRFIDQLTSLKNRNYLTENLENWNNNTIYPQAVIVIDLNKVQDINDTLGYEQGDSQIQAAANILVKTQLDNTDIIRTDGNEFLVYLVGYETKQITSYIHKLNKEFKKLPFEYGAAIGYSMITDDVKSIEDATNEAIEQVKSQKEEIKDE